MPEVLLQGCTPEPIMNYLKALGILRLVSEQVDTRTRGCWRNEAFALSSCLDSEELVVFLIDRYQPTPIVAPWAGGSGFFKGDNQEAVTALSAPTVAHRCLPYREAIRTVRQVLRQEGIVQKPSKEQKEIILQRYRRELSLPVVEWMDAAMVLQQAGQVFAPLLGTGGNDGRLDFTQNFMSRLVKLGFHNSRANEHAEGWCRQALFGVISSGLPSAAIGQYAPGRAGGPNATQGMEGNPLDNPWDFVLMMEGSLCLAGAAARRLGLGGDTRASFPFTVKASPVGFSSSAEKDVGAARGEIWLPVWKRWVSLAELRCLLGEGRATVGSRSARNGVDFARAVATLGVDRGIDEFVRVSFLRRSGKAYLATPTGRFRVPAKVRSEADLLREIDPWLDRFRAAVGDQVPVRLGSALRRIESAIFDFCKYGGKVQFQAVIAALGRAEREVAQSSGEFKKRLSPIPLLSREWGSAGDDGNIAIELARSVATMSAPDAGPLRMILEPIACGRGMVVWSDRNQPVDWHTGDLCANLRAILLRRTRDRVQEEDGRLPLGSIVSAPLSSVASFLVDDSNDELIGDLIWGLSPIAPQSPDNSSKQGAFTTPLPRVYSLLKLLFLPGSLLINRTRYSIPTAPALLPLLASNRIDEACQIAVRRLFASGLTPLPNKRGSLRERDWKETTQSAIDGRRLAAALLFPISAQSVRIIAELVLRIESPETRPEKL